LVLGRLLLGRYPAVCENARHDALLPQKRMSSLEHAQNSDTNVYGETHRALRAGAQERAIADTPEKRKGRLPGLPEEAAPTTAPGRPLGATAKRLAQI
jgi:hypothetical protein